jgi:hypothetical protein
VTLTIEEARVARDKILQGLEEVCEERDPTWSEQAMAFILKAMVGKSSVTGEDLVDQCKKAGILPPTTDRAFGPIFMSLSKKGVIRRIGFEARRKGHAAPGASMWTLA